MGCFLLDSVIMLRMNLQLKINPITLLTYFPCHQTRSPPTLIAHGENQPPNLSVIPLEYHVDKGKVFSKERTLSLPPHRTYEYVIELLHGVPSSKLYNLSCLEHKQQQLRINIPYISSTQPSNLFMGLWLSQAGPEKCWPLGQN